MQKHFWHSMNFKDVCNYWSTNTEKGLDKKAAQELLLKIGHNRLKEKPKKPLFIVFIEQLNNFIIWTLIVAAVISAVTGHMENPTGGFFVKYGDFVAIMLIVLLNAFLGLFQEIKADAAMEALKKMSARQAKVIRNGELLTIEAEELVCGDVIVLEEGDIIPADIKVFETHRFSTSEAALTGESVAVMKQNVEVIDKEAPLSERINMVYMGTTVATGRARGIVVNTGMFTELGKIAKSIDDISDEDTPLQKKLNEFGHQIVYLCIVVSVIIFLIGILRDKEGSLMLYFMTAVSLAVAAIPEGLPAITTIVMALGTQRMAGKNAIVRKLASVETLGCTTVICTDKTGTLTQNKMVLKKIYCDGDYIDVTGEGYEIKGQLRKGKHIVSNDDIIKPHSATGAILDTGILCNNARIKPNEKDPGIVDFVGDPTEVAFLVAAKKAAVNIDAKYGEYTFFDEVPFSSERKMMTKVYKKADEYMIYTKGAPEMVMARAKFTLENGKIVALDDKKKKELLDVNEKMAAMAFRVLGLAGKSISADSVDSSHENDANLFEKDLIFYGLAGIMDPPKIEVKDSIELCRRAGISTVMITGDHKGTASAIARDLGILTEGRQSLSGAELDRIDDEKLTEICSNTAVFARVTAEHKLRIVKAFKNRGEVVAMTGDGINDAPAIKEASIGIAMGIAGTDVTKSAADMVLADDNFSTIVAAVEEGRVIYNNIKKFIYFLFSSNMGLVFAIFFTVIFGWRQPVFPLQILWINLITNGLPALALGVDPAERDLMSKKPRSTKDKIIGPWEFWMILVNGVIMGIAALYAFYYEYYVIKEASLTPQQQYYEACTMAFAILALSPIIHAFSCRSKSISAFRGVFENTWIWFSAVFAVALQLIAVHYKPLQSAFKTIDISFEKWFVIIGLSILPLLFMEFYKIGLKIKGKKIE
ncbi:MAG: Calcium-transporting ATPase 1 [bacterium ADurb.Bin243]|nr:MAG: Calcium-transporting ATPase 1 [bacterium ADurb.Bin243]